MNEDLARAQHALHLERAARERRALRVRNARRWQRRAERAALRARLALAAL